MSLLVITLGAIAGIIAGLLVMGVGIGILYALCCIFGGGE